LRFLAGFDTTSILINLCELRLAAFKNIVGRRLQLVCSADRRDIPFLELLELLDQSPNVVEVLGVGVRIEQNWNCRSISHELKNNERLNPNRLVGVTQAEPRGHAQATYPQHF
jgi:hypothetical protein